MGKLPRRIAVAQTLALLAALAVVVPAEIEHWQDARRRHWTDWFIGVNVDTTLPLLLIIVVPYFWFVRRPFWTPSGRWWQTLKTWWSAGPETLQTRRRLTQAAMLLIALMSLEVSWRVASQPVGGDLGVYQFGDLPPAYHDEYSYRLQAETYLAGRLSFPSHLTAARLFDQMHVLNEGQFASRYFPATGLWIAPWLWLGWPILGHWLAGAATAVFVFGIGRELSSNGTGFVAGMLTALSPGMGLFGNLLLAHHPTLLGLFCFAWSFLRWLRTGRVRDLAFASIGLSWAMLCRPMTAAGFGLPFGVVFAWQWVRYFKSESNTVETVQEKMAATTSRPNLGLVLGAMVIPLLAGFVALGVQNKAITGSLLISPYPRFTDIYSPRHGYGFNNVERTKTETPREVFQSYDNWAENLTPTLAIENAKNRLIASWQWTVGIVPLLSASVLFLLTGHGRDRRWWLIVAAIASLFFVHVPYWFDGIFHWHYVFETGPLWCLLLAAATDTLCHNWLAAERSRMPIWWGAIVGAAVLVNHVDVIPFWYPSKLEAGVEQIAFSRLRYQAFDELLQREVRQRPALVLIEADPSDRHIDYVVNEPSLSAGIIRGRYPVADWPLERVIAEFPARHVYLFRAKTGELRSVTTVKAK